MKGTGKLQENVTASVCKVQLERRIAARLRDTLARKRRELTPQADSEHPSSPTAVSPSLENEELLPGCGTGVYKPHPCFSLALSQQQISSTQQRGTCCCSPELEGRARGGGSQ